MRSDNLPWLPGSPLLLALLLSGCPSSNDSLPPPPAAPSSVSVTARDGYVLVDATLGNDATGAYVYWSAASSVDAASGTRVSVGSSPQAITALTNGTTYYFRVSATNAGGESALSSVAAAVPAAAAVAADPLYVDQWHLKSTGSQSGAGSTALAGEDLNVEPAWTTSKGSGVRIAVVDDGLEIGHEDLGSNMAANDKSYNYVTGTNDPTNSADDTSSGHGTAVAGIIAARGNNGIGVSGVAPRASLAGYNLLQNLTSSNEVDAMTRNAATVSISSNSWGAADGTGELDASTSLWKSAIETGLATGRGGLGTVYLWAAGNGGTENTSFFPYGTDSSNYDGRANYRGVIAVAAVNDKGTKSSYSERGANLWISAPGGEYCSTHTITTTDRTGSAGLNTSATTSDYASKGYTKCMNGTSSATPGAAGVVALMLAANPGLGWRDVRLILAQTARKNDQTVSGNWEAAGTGGYSYSHKYGFGVANAASAVSAAAAYGSNLTTEVTYVSAVTSPPSPSVPDYSTTGSSSTIAVPAGTGISAIEFVEITLTATHPTNRGDYYIVLTSPSGTTSTLAWPHYCVQKINGVQTAVNCTIGFNNWVFGSARHLGEVATGNWTLKLMDYIGDGTGATGSFVSWKLKLYGH